MLPFEVLAIYNISYYYENRSIVHSGIIAFMVLFMINDGSAKTVSYVQNCGEIAKGHIPYGAVRLLYTIQCFGHILFSVSAFGINV